MIRSSLLNLLTIITILVSSLSTLSYAYTLSDIDEKKAQMRNRDRELLQLEKKRRNIAGDESILIGELKKLENRLRTLDIQIYKHTQAIHTEKQRVTYLEGIVQHTKKEVGLRLRTMYVQEDVYYLSRTKSISDLFIRLDKIYKTMKQDRKLLSHFKVNHRRFQQAQKIYISQLRVLNEEKERANKLLQLLHAKMVKNRQNEVRVAKQIGHLESENEELQESAFQLTRIALTKASAYESNKGAPTITVDQLYWPVDGGKITSSFGYRLDPVQKVNRLHRGVDIGGPFGSPIKAAAGGRVIESRPSTGYGYIVVLYHGTGMSTLYAHMYGSTVTVKVGDFVHKGQVIARVGSNGWSTGPHLHFEVIEAGKVRNPIAFFARKGRR